MGYYTYYNLAQVKNPIDEELLKTYLDAKDLGWLLDVNENEPTKWYDYDDDMKALSAKFPNTVFQLHGDGESSDDVWERYYHNGELIKKVTLNTELPVPDLSKY